MKKKLKAPPCKECILFPKCKQDIQILKVYIRMHEDNFPISIKGNSAIIISFLFFKLTNKCSLIKNYILASPKTIKIYLNLKNLFFNEN